MGIILNAIGNQKLCSVHSSYCDIESSNCVCKIKTDTYRHTFGIFMFVRKNVIFQSRKKNWLLNGMKRCWWWDNSCTPLKIKGSILFFVKKLMQIERIFHPLWNVHCRAQLLQHARFSNSLKQNRHLQYNTGNIYLLFFFYCRGKVGRD